MPSKRLSSRRFVARITPGAAEQPARTVDGFRQVLFESHVTGEQRGLRLRLAVAAHGAIGHDASVLQHRERGIERVHRKPAGREHSCGISDRARSWRRGFASRRRCAAAHSRNRIPSRATGCKRRRDRSHPPRPSRPCRLLCKARATARPCGGRFSWPRYRGKLVARSDRQVRSSRKGRRGNGRAAERRAWSLRSGRGYAQSLPPRRTRSRSNNARIISEAKPWVGGGCCRACRRRS